MAAKFDDKDYFSIFFSFIQMKLSLKIGNQLKLIKKKTFVKNLKPLLKKKTPKLMNHWSMCAKLYDKDF